jgi:hypothetical protein
VSAIKEGGGAYDEEADDDEEEAEATEEAELGGPDGDGPRDEEGTMTEEKRAPACTGPPSDDIAPPSAWRRA